MVHLFQLVQPGTIIIIITIYQIVFCRQMALVGCSLLLSSLHLWPCKHRHHYMSPAGRPLAGFYPTWCTQQATGLPRQTSSFPSKYKLVIKYRNTTGHRSANKTLLTLITFVCCRKIYSHIILEVYSTSMIQKDYLNLMYIFVKDQHFDQGLRVFCDLSL